ncbi:MAG: hypothetical protein QM752_01460 [Gammaproteobacteria bacterium]
MMSQKKGEVSSQRTKVEEIMPQTKPQIQKAYVESVTETPEEKTEWDEVDLVGQYSSTQARAEQKKLKENNSAKKASDLSFLTECAIEAENTKKFFSQSSWRGGLKLGIGIFFPLIATLLYHPRFYEFDKEKEGKNFPLKEQIVKESLLKIDRSRQNIACLSASVVILGYSALLLAHDHFHVQSLNKFSNCLGSNQFRKIADFFGDHHANAMIGVTVLMLFLIGSAAAILARAGAQAYHSAKLMPEIEQIYNGKKQETSRLNRAKWALYGFLTGLIHLLPTVCLTNNHNVVKEKPDERSGIDYGYPYQDAPLRASKKALLSSEPVESNDRDDIEIIEETNAFRSV